MDEELPVGYFIRRWAEVIFPLAFLFGFILNISILMIVAGVLMIIEDVMGILTHELNPLFPVIFAFILAVIVSPWYIGIFWSVEVFALLNVPTSIGLILFKKMREKDKENYNKQRFIDLLK